MNKKILFLTNIPAPYMVDFLNELGQYCQLMVVFERANSAVRDVSWNKWEGANFEYSILEGFNLGGPEADMAICPQVVRYLNGEYDRIIVANPCTPTGIVATWYMRLHKIPHGFLSEGAFPGTGKGLKEFIKRTVYSRGDFYFSTAQLEDQYYLMYGAEKDRIKKYVFTSLYAHDLLDKPVTDEKKEILRQELGIKHKQMIISVGRLIPRKGYDKLIEAFVGLPSDIGLYIIGDEPTKEYVELKRKYNLNNLQYIGFMSPEEVKQYYMAADLFALNTREDTWGLVINEAMACGLPVITTLNCYAGLTLIEDGINGYLLPVDDVQGFHNAMRELLSDKSLMQEMAINNIEKSREYTIEKMAEHVMNGLFE